MSFEAVIGLALVAGLIACAPVTMAAILLAAFLLHAYCRLILGGYTVPLQLPQHRLPSSASLRHRRSRSPSKAPRREPDGKSEKPLIVVTGGAGMLGFTVARQLVETNAYDVEVVDIAPPSPARRLSAVRTYHVIDIAHAGDSRLDIIFAGAAAVVHTAGIVDLTADSGRTFNAHVVGSWNVLEAAERCGLCAAVVTSSIGAVTSPYVAYSQADLPADYLPPGFADGTFPYHSSYGATKLEAERSALARDRPGFRVCALRMPMIFGLEDPMVVAPLLSGLLDRVPDVAGAPLVEFCYVENAAAAHVRALQALMEHKPSNKGATAPRIGGRAFNVTNGDKAQSAFALWDSLARKAASRQKALRRPLPHIKPLKRLPFAALFVVACISELVFALCCGHVPRRRATFWNLTRASLRLSGTTVTQSMVATREELGFVPEFSTLEAFDHMLLQWKG